MKHGEEGGVVGRSVGGLAGESDVMQTKLSLQG